jgi:hypothetical protein
MKTFTKLFAFSLILAGGPATAQWCIPPTGPFGSCSCINTYGSSSPVITNVTYNTINRSSSMTMKELYVNTGVSTNVIRGQSYNFSTTFSLDPNICPVYLVRVYVDWNIDGDFSDPGETALSSPSLNAGSYSAALPVPSSATLGVTRMRVAMKMDGCGHTAPDPCLVTDGASIGWHGEVEDYTLNVQQGTGISELNAGTAIEIFPNPVSLSATVSVNVNVKNAQFVVYDVLGKEAMKINLANGAKSFTFERGNLNAGLYLYKLISDNSTISAGKLVIE